jgi:hypothetical protein
LPQTEAPGEQNGDQHQAEKYPARESKPTDKRSLMLSPRHSHPLSVYGVVSPMLKMTMEWSNHESDCFMTRPAKTKIDCCFDFPEASSTSWNQDLVIKRWELSRQLVILSQNLLCLLEWLTARLRAR